MRTIIGRCSQAQIDAMRERFPKAVKARAIIIKGGTITFDVPADAVKWEASPRQVFDALTLSDLAAEEPAFTSIGVRLNSLIMDNVARSISVQP